MPAKNVLVCKNVWKVFNKGTETEQTVLRDVSFSVKEGELVCLLGASGSGKSTLLNIIGALDKPTKGTVMVDGSDIGEMSERQLAYLRGKKIGFVFQTFNLVPSLTALQNVELPMIFRGMGKDERLARARELLTEVGLEKKFHQMPNKLSGGERQRVSIARSLANNPAIILADEPTGNLDSKSAAHIIEILKKLNKLGRTIFIITHDLGIAAQMRRKLRIVDGVIHQER